MFSLQTNEFLTFFLKCLSPGLGVVLTVPAMYTCSTLLYFILDYFLKFQVLANPAALYFCELCPFLSSFWKLFVSLFVTSAASCLLWPLCIPVCHLWIQAAQIIFLFLFLSCCTNPLWLPFFHIQFKHLLLKSPCMWCCPCLAHRIRLLYLHYSHKAKLLSSLQVVKCQPIFLLAMYFPSAKCCVLNTCCLFMSVSVGLCRTEVICCDLNLLW